MILAMKELPKESGREVPVYVADEDLNRQGLNKEDLAILAVGSAGLGIVILAGGVLASTAVLVSVMTVGSGAILWVKLPEKLESVPVVSSLIKFLPISVEKKQQLLEINWKDKVDDHELLVDILVSAGVFFLFGSSVTGLISAGMTGLFVSVMFRTRKIIRRLGKQLQSQLKERVYEQYAA